MAGRCVALVNPLGVDQRTIVVLKLGSITQFEKSTFIAGTGGRGIARSCGQVAQNRVAKLALIHSASLVEVEASDGCN